MKMGYSQCQLAQDFFNSSDTCFINLYWFDLPKFTPHEQASSELQIPLWNWLFLQTRPPPGREIGWYQPTWIWLDLTMLQFMFYKFKPWLLKIKKNHSAIINAIIGNHLNTKKCSTTSFSNIHLKSFYFHVIFKLEQFHTEITNHKKNLINTNMQSFWNQIEIIKAYCNPWMYVSILYIFRNIYS